MDYSDVRGQEYVKRALTVAASGAHNILMIGPPVAERRCLPRFPSILPAMNLNEAIEITKIHSVSGLLPLMLPLYPNALSEARTILFLMPVLSVAEQYPKPARSVFRIMVCFFLTNCRNLTGMFLRC
jgi:hypothetical protein